MRRHLFLLLSAIVVVPGARADSVLLNVSYDVMRDFYRDYNPAFAKHYQAQNHGTITIQQSHGGSSKQARAVIDGLEADVVTMNQSLDIDMIAAKGKQVRTDWAQQFPNDSAPFSSLQVLIVRSGNPKHIKDWSDLVRPGVSVVMPNPKTSGGARWNFLAAWAYALRRPGGNENAAKDFVTKLYKNVPVLDSGARGSTTTFTERGIGDVLVGWESDALLATRDLGPDKYSIVYPPTSILAEPPVAVVDKVVDAKGTRAIAEAYVKYLYTPQGQQIIAKHFFRPRLPSVVKQYASTFPNIRTVTVSQVFGSWKSAQQKFFDDGALFDQIYQPQ
jgi:sulfate/thiosulfate-binding protein